MQISITVWSSMQCMVCCMSWVILVMWFCILCAKQHNQYVLEEDKLVRSIQKSIVVLEEDKLKFNVFVDLGRFSYSFTTYFSDDIKPVCAVKWWGIEKILGRDFGLGVSYSSQCFIVGSQSQHLSPA